MTTQVNIGTDNIVISKAQNLDTGTTATLTLVGNQLVITETRNSDSVVLDTFSISLNGIFDGIRATFNQGIDSKLAENHFAAGGTYTDPRPGVAQGIKVSGGIATDNIYANGYYSKGDFQFELPNGQYMLIQQGTGGTIFRGAQTRIVFQDQTPLARVESFNGGACSISASGFTTVSDQAQKKNIELLTISALDEIKSTPVYQYNYLNEVDGVDPKHTGVLLQQSPIEIVDPAGQGVDIYGMASMAFKAIQELSAKNDALEARIAVLEAK